MSLTVEFKPPVAERFHIWAEGLEIPVELYVGMLFMELFGLDWQCPDSPYHLPMPEVEFPTEAERMTDDFVNSFRKVCEQNRNAVTEAVAHKHNLMADVDRLERQSAHLQHEATDALRDGDRENAKHQLKQKASCDNELLARREELSAAETAVEDLKRHIRQAAEQIKARAMELAARHPENMSAEERPAFAAELLAKLDSLSLDAERTLSGTGTNNIEASAIEAATEEAEAANAAPQISVQSPVPVQPTSLTLEISPAAETLLETEAQARGFSSSEYLNAVAEQLVNLADLVTPAGMTPKRDPNDYQNIPIEEVLNQAVQEMKESQIRNREYAVQAITQKNNLQAEVDKEERMLAEFKRKALKTLDEGNRPLAEQFYKERQRHEQTCEIMRGLLTQATEIAEKVKERIKQEEERIRVRTSKALLLKANLAASVIAFRLDMLQEEMPAPDDKQFQQDFDDWVQAQKPPYAD